MGPNIQPKDGFGSNIKLTDVNKIEYSYESNSVVLISRYSDTIAIIEPGSSNFTQYVGDMYSESILLSCSKMADFILYYGNDSSFSSSSISKCNSDHYPLESRTDH